MKLKNIIYSILILGMVGLIFSSCYKEPDWVGDNTTTEGKHFPVIAGVTLVTAGDFFQEGSTIQIDLDYWSLDDIATVKLYENVDGGGATEVSSTSHVSNFQEDSQTDEMILSYTIPTLPSDTVEIVLDVEVINVNGLTRNSKNGGTANRPSISIMAIK